MNRFSKKLDAVLYRYRRNRWRFNYRKFFVDVDRVKIDRPVFLLGTQGGGLTLISRILRRNPVAVSVTGDSDYWNGPDEMHNVLSPVLPEELRLRGCALYGRHDFGTGGWTYATDRHVEHFRKRAEDAGPELAAVFRRLIKEILVLQARDPEKARFVDKSQTYTLKVSFIREMLNGCDPRFVLLLRNPYAMCYRAALKTNMSKALSGHSTEQRLGLAAQHWSNSVSAALEDGAGHDDMLTVRIEDFLANPVESLKRICEFVEFEYDSRMLPQPDDRFPLGGLRDSKWYPLNPEINAPYLDALDGRETALIRNRCGKLAERFGYTQ